VRALVDAPVCGCRSLPSGSLGHTLAVADLPPLHGDPFDRLIVAQARAEGLTLVSADANVLRYDVKQLRA
jgi:PIN domain nuclease of toxin-antitoxin system